MQKGSNPKGKYLRTAAVLVLLNYIVILLLYMGYRAAYFFAFYTVIISTGNLVAHLVLFIKNRQKSGYGFISSIPLGISGIFLLFLLIRFFIKS